MTTTTAVNAFRIPLDHESDTSGLAALVTEGKLDASAVIGVTGKVEGNWPGEQTRIAADTAVRRYLTGAGATAESVARIPMIFSSGGVGIMTPHIVVYARVPWNGVIDSQPRLVVGSGRTQPLDARWLGSSRMVSECANAVRSAMEDGDMTRDEARFVIAKSPSPSEEQLDEAGVSPAIRRALLPLVSGATALGIGVALGEFELPDESRIGVDQSLWTGRASCSVGRERPFSQMLALGNSTRAGGTLTVGASVMHDVIDVTALDRALADAGLEIGASGITDEILQRIVAVYLKIGEPDGTIRGRRQVQDARNSRYGSELKAAVGGAFAGRLGDTALYISSAAVHQGPPNGGTVAVVVDHS